MKLSGQPTWKDMAVLANRAVLRCSVELPCLMPTVSTESARVVTHGSSPCGHSQQQIFITQTSFKLSSSFDLRFSVTFSKYVSYSPFNSYIHQPICHKLPLANLWILRGTPSPLFSHLYDGCWMLIYFCVFPHTHYALHFIPCDIFVTTCSFVSTHFSNVNK